jgi:hypothetical protein
VGGVIARQLTRSLAERSEDPKEIALIFRAADPIERFMVIPGSMLVVVFGVFLALVTGAPILGFLQGASRNWLLVANLLILTFIALVPAVFLPRGKVFARSLDEAIRRGQVTPELRASLHDRVVRFSHAYEIVAVIVVVVLMVFKPF